MKRKDFELTDALYAVGTFEDKYKLSYVGPAVMLCFFYGMRYVVNSSIPAGICILSLMHADTGIDQQCNETSRKKIRQNSECNPKDSKRANE